MDKNNIVSSDFDSHLNNLLNTAEDIFNIIDTVSATVHKLESRLNKVHTNIPYLMQVNEEVERTYEYIKEEHKRFDPDAHGYHIKRYNYLSWEPAQENSKTFRLFVIVQEKEILESTVHYDDRAFLKTIPLEPQCILKKPLLESNIQTRLQYSKHLTPFINAFQEHLLEFRNAIMPADDALPF